MSRSMAVLCVAAAFSAPSFAQSTVDGQWHGAVAIGGAAASSNTSSQALNMIANGTRESKEDKISLYSLANYGSSKAAGVTTRTAQLFRLGGRYDRNLTDKMFWFTGGELDTNRLQNISSRYNVNTGLGYKVIRDADMSLDVFGGVGYSGTKFVNVTPPASSSVKGAELLLGEESSHKLSSTSTFKQRFVIYPGQSEIGTHSTLDLSLATVISGAWTLNVGAAVAYNSKPSAGFKTTSSLLTFGFGYKY